MHTTFSNVSLDKSSLQSYIKSYRKACMSFCENNRNDHVGLVHYDNLAPFSFLIHDDKFKYYEIHESHVMLTNDYGTYDLFVVDQGYTLWFTDDAVVGFEKRPVMHMFYSVDDVYDALGIVMVDEDSVSAPF